MALRMCPYIDDPDADCYCINLNSQTVEAVILYCGGVFEECRYFQRRKKLESPTLSETSGESQAEGSRPYSRGR